MAGTNSSSKPRAFAIPATTFRRVAKELLGPDNSFSAESLLLLQQVTEDHVASTMDKAGAIAAYSERSTVYAGDLQMVQMLGGR